MNLLSQTSCVRSPSTPVFPLRQTCVNHWAIALFFSLFFVASKIHHSLTALILSVEWTHQSPHWLHCEGDRMHPIPRQCLVLLFTLMNILSLVQSQGKTLQIERRCSSTCGLIAILAFVLGFFFFVCFPSETQCTVEQFKQNQMYYDDNFDISNLAESYPDQRSVRVSCKVGYSGFFKMTCSGNQWTYKGNKCQRKFHFVAVLKRKTRLPRVITGHERWHFWV